MKGAPCSEQFDDIYFSREDGVEETRHVFLNSNNLPQAWEGKDSFVIAETGFGTGLNFLSAWKLFEETANDGQTLDFISVEKYPLTPDFIREALQQWGEYFAGRLEILCDNYPLRIAGFHRVKINSQITLTLIFEDIADAFPQLEASVDCWFLDGFTPSKNPDMWSVDVFEQMARLSNADASYATFTAAGDVRRGLSDAGFSVEKIKGYGRKRDMIVGKFLAKTSVPTPVNKTEKPKRIAIIGGGLAGTSCAYVLKQYGFDPVIYEAGNHLAAGASGSSRGMYNPRFTAKRGDISNFFAPAYAQFTRLAGKLGNDIEHNPCGALHLMDTPEKEKRFKSLIDNWGWDEAHARIVNAEEASDIAGVNIDCEALFLPDSGSVRPTKICKFYARDIEVNLNTKIEDLANINADAIILCNAIGAKNFTNLEWLPLENVRGQVSVFNETNLTTKLKCNIHYGGYISAAMYGVNVIGATFQKWYDHTDVVGEDHDENIGNLKSALPVLKDEDLTVHTGWAGLRTTSPDRLPLVGAVPNMPNVYISTAFGSHGLVASLASAHYLSDLLRYGVKSLPINTSKMLNPQRFIDRALRKSGKMRKSTAKS